MKLKRNDPCPCGSGKKYKLCCMNLATAQFAEIVEQIVAMNPSLSIDDLDTVVQHKIHQQNNRPNPDFCGLSSSQMADWLYGAFDDVHEVTITTPKDLSLSPVMRYLGLILQEAEQNDWSFKATTKGNLPAKLVKQASDFLPEFAVSQFETGARFCDFAGSNEDKFNALHYTRVLAEIAGIIYRRSGRYHVKKSAQKQFYHERLNAFFKPMLEAAIMQYNWGYLDGWTSEVDLRLFWRFMLWRLHCHVSTDQLTQEMIGAFPDLLEAFDPDDYFPPEKMLANLIQLRFLERFLQFWGFVTIEAKYIFAQESGPDAIQLQPLFKETFAFNLS